jgi:hypothetical protein
MLYCSIEDAWGPLPVNEQVKKYKGGGLEHFQNIIKKKVNKKINKKPKRNIRKLKERFEDTEESCDSEEPEFVLDYDQDLDQEQDQDQDQEKDLDQEDYQESESEAEPTYTENTTIINLKKKVNKLIKENSNLKDKIKKFKKNKPLVLDDFINDFLTDKNREIIVMTLIGLMIIVIFHLLVRSSK